MIGVMVISGLAWPVLAGGADEEPYSRPMQAQQPPKEERWFPKGDPPDEWHEWAVHDKDRPLPPVVEPGTCSTQARAGRAPSDAVVLFDGNDPNANLDAWVPVKPDSPGWHVRDGYFEVNPGAGALRTVESFGDCQLHVEWQVPLSLEGKFDQSRGNSGVFLMSRYEVQVLDNKDNETYADGMAGAIYGQSPPLVNPGLGLGRWQSYDIVFRRPHFDEQGNVVEPATITVFHNGVLVQDHWVLEGPMSYKRRTSYRPHGDQAPLMLQDHGSPVRYRNIWVRRLSERPISAFEAKMRQACSKDSERQAEGE